MQNNIFSSILQFMLIFCLLGCDSNNLPSVLVVENVRCVARNPAEWSAKDAKVVVAVRNGVEIEAIVYDCIANAQSIGQKNNLGSFYAILWKQVPEHLKGFRGLGEEYFIVGNKCAFTFTPTEGTGLNPVMQTSSEKSYTVRIAIKMFEIIRNKSSCN